MNNTPTALFNLHKEFNAKLVGFAGYSLPIQYKSILAEHLHCRSACSLFDVSHMGQCLVTSSPKDLEKVITADLEGLAVDQLRYSLFTNDKGGVLDDLMVTKKANYFYLVVNAACKEKDFKILETTLGKGKIQILTDQALFALQGPKSASVLSQLAPQIDNLQFMRSCEVEIMGAKCLISRSGYTGEDGFEISVANSNVDKICRALLENPLLNMAGLGARDSLRLEAGLCLYGQDLDENITPIEAGINFAISKKRRQDQDFKGSDTILSELKNGVKRQRIGLLCEGRLPVRQGADVFYNQEKIGKVTSGCFSPSLNKPIAMAYLNKNFTKIGTKVSCQVRDKVVSAQVVTLPFVPHNYKRN